MKEIKFFKITKCFKNKIKRTMPSAHLNLPELFFNDFLAMVALKVQSAKAEIFDGVDGRMKIEVTDE